MTVTFHHYKVEVLNPAEFFYFEKFLKNEFIYFGLLLPAVKPFLPLGLVFIRTCVLLRVVEPCLRSCP